MGLTLTNNRHYLTCRNVSQSVVTVPSKEKDIVTIFQNYWDLLSPESDIPEQIENTFHLYCTRIKYTKEPFRELPFYAPCIQGENKVLHSFKKLSLGASTCFCLRYWGSREAISDQAEVEHITPIYLGAIKFHQSLEHLRNSLSTIYVQSLQNNVYSPKSSMRKSNFLPF